MPSPFPGMDPYLESPEFFHDLHILLIAQLTEMLNTGLPDGFSARMEEQIYGDDKDFIVQGERLQHILVTTARGQRRVVAAIEVLSPVNKRGRGREQYLDKQQELLQSEVHLIEIDLLRSGQHTLAVDATLLREETDWDYLVCLHRAGASLIECWDLRITERLPAIPIPLNAETPDFIVDLQTAFDALYEKGPFRREIDYTSEPTPRLPNPTALWAETLLKEKGLGRDRIGAP